MACLNFHDRKCFCSSILTFLLVVVLTTAGSASAVKSVDLPPKGPDKADQVKTLYERAVATISEGLNGDAENLLLSIVEKNLPEKDKALFLLGRLYMETENPEKAEHYLQKSVAAYPLLRNYAFKSLTLLYMASGDYEKAVDVAQKITSSLLLQSAQKSQITSLLALDRKNAAKDTLMQYTIKYPGDWDHQLILARLLEELGETGAAVQRFKAIYLDAVPQSSEAFIGLKRLKADKLSGTELLQRADSLYKNNDFQRAEAAYRKALDLEGGPEKKGILFSIAMCQFRQKRYGESAETFGLVHTPRAMYWQARSYYRRSERERFEGIRDEFARTYPENDKLALLFLMDGDESRRDGRFPDAEENYGKVLDLFPEKKEEALWGLGWLNYTAGRYKDAADYFSRLSSFTKSRDYYKYVFWGARSREKLYEECRKSVDSTMSGKDRQGCEGETVNFFSELPSDKSYYGYLIQLRSMPHAVSGRVELLTPSRPQGEMYERIEALSSMGLRDEAVNEILDALKNVKARKDFLYLGYMAMKMDEYNRVIYYAEPRKDRELLPYSYPLGFWDKVKPEADSRNLDAHLIAALIREESRFNPRAVSWAGAVGLMQIMPSTAQMLKKQVAITLDESSQLQDPGKNIVLGTYYLSRLVQELEQLPLAIAAYNAGEKILKEWTTRFSTEDIIEFIENIPYRETRNYVKKVLKSYWQYRTINGLPIQDDLHGSGAAMTVHLPTAAVAERN